MNSARIEMLLRFTKEEPEDPFNWYALAMEYLYSDPVQAQAILEKLTIKHEYYVPTYYHLAKVLEQQNRPDEAILIYKKGIVQSQKAGDHKALRELQSALDELIFDSE